VSIDRTPPGFSGKEAPGVVPDQGDGLPTPGPLKPPGRFGLPDGLPEPVEGAVPTDPQMAVFHHAFRLYQERNAGHRDVWKESGWMGMLVDIRKKADRLWVQYNAYEPDEDVTQADLDSALDLLNFTAFFIRQVRNNNRNGSWDWR
jgi:hypothetical protein